MSKIVILSIKPEFADKILAGKKSIELRKCMPDAKAGDVIVIYSTDPVKAIVGICRIKEILRLKPSLMWRDHRDTLGIDKKRFSDYFREVDTAVGIVLTSILQLDHLLSLDAIKKVLPHFHPPQTFRYYPKTPLYKAYLNSIAV
jgi:predicted transcriptional regulator